MRQKRLGQSAHRTFRKPSLSEKGRAHAKRRRQRKQETQRTAALSHADDLLLRRGMKSAVTNAISFKRRLKAQSFQPFRRAIGVVRIAEGETSARKRRRDEQAMRVRLGGRRRNPSFQCRGKYPRVTHLLSISRLILSPSARSARSSASSPEARASLYFSKFPIRRSSSALR